MAYDFTKTRRVEFSETDMAGIMHFSNYFRFIESAEHAFFRSLGLRIHGSESDGTMFGWARVQAGCDYHAPLHYEDIVETHLYITAIGERSLSYVADLRRCDGDGHPKGDPVARARWKVVYIRRGPDEKRMRSAKIPKDVAAVISAAPNDVLKLLEKDDRTHA